MKRLWVTFGVALSVIALEIYGSYLSGSLALLADAFHVASDALAIGVSLLAMHWASRPQSQKRSFGLYRLEILAALFNGVVLLALAASIYWKAYERWYEPHPLERLSLMSFATVGLAANVFMLLYLRTSHNHNLNTKGAYLHIIGDTLSSIGVFVGAIFIFVTGYERIDAVASCFVATVILVMSVRFISESAHVLLEGTPPHLSSEKIQEEIRNEFPQITQIHDFHIWEITTHLLFMTAHLEAAVSTLEESQNLTRSVSRWVHERYHIGHTTLQIEPAALRPSSET